MASTVLLGTELDIFQAARLRTWWFTPTVLDHSGVATAKTETAIMWALLRLLLLPNPTDTSGMARIVTHYFPRKGLADEEYLPRFEKYVERSNLLYRQIKLQIGRKMWRQLDGCVRLEFLSGARLELPAGDFMKDSQNQASKSFNDLIVDEAGEIDLRSKGVNLQLVARARMRCFNPFHPIWMNHKKFLGHAEEPGHPYHKRQKSIDKARKQGSQDHGSFTACYLDYRGELKRKYGEVAAKQAADQKTGLTDAEFKQIWIGLWARGSKSWYGASQLEDLERRDVGVLLARPAEDRETIFALGNDSAPGMTGGSDWNAFVTWAATPVDVSKLTADTDLTGLVKVNGEVWFVRLVHALMLHGASVDQRSGLIHRLHRGFGYSGLAMDPQGGGAEVYRKLTQNRQLIDNSWQKVVPLCSLRDAFSNPAAQPLVGFYDRGDADFRRLMGPRYVADNSGPVDFAHTQMRTAVMKRHFALPAARAKLGPEAVRRMGDEEQQRLADIARVVSQFPNIRCKMDKNGEPVTSANGFRQFTNGSHKKDGAMAAIYGYLKLMSLLGAARGTAEAEETAMAVFG